MVQLNDNYNEIRKKERKKEKKEKDISSPLYSRGYYLKVCIRR
jgi:hypothetical protein